MPLRSTFKRTRRLKPSSTDPGKPTHSNYLYSADAPVPQRRSAVSVVTKPNRFSSTPTVRPSSDLEGQRTSRAAPVGFLNVPTQGKEEKTARDSLFSDFRLLQKCFPDFPISMLKTLFIREAGNGLEVLKILETFGWTNSKEARKWRTLNPPQFDLLSHEPNPHFTVSYFWGEFSVDLLNYLPSKGGCFFTAVERPNLYILCYVNKKLEVKRRDIDSPTVIPILMDLYGLKDGLARPSHLRPSRLLALFDS